MRQIHQLDGTRPKPQYLASHQGKQRAKEVCKIFKSVLVSATFLRSDRVNLTRSPFQHRQPEQCSLRLWPMNAFGPSPRESSSPAMSPSESIQRAHPALPASQQRRINAWLAASPSGSLGPNNMYQLTELARHMDRAERIRHQIDATQSIDPRVRQSLLDLAAAEDARIQALSQQLGIPGK